MPGRQSWFGHQPSSGGGSTPPASPLQVYQATQGISPRGGGDGTYTFPNTTTVGNYLIYLTIGGGTYFTAPSGWTRQIDDSIGGGMTQEVSAAASSYSLPGMGVTSGTAGPGFSVLLEVGAAPTLNKYVDGSNQYQYSVTESLTPTANSLIIAVVESYWIEGSAPPAPIAFSASNGGLASVSIPSSTVFVNYYTFGLSGGYSLGTAEADDALTVTGSVTPSSSTDRNPLLLVTAWT